MKNESIMHFSFENEATPHFFGYEKSSGSVFWVTRNGATEDFWITCILRYVQLFSFFSVVFKFYDSKPYIYA